MTDIATGGAREVPGHRLRAFELHLGRELAAAERAAFAEGYQAGRRVGPLPCPYRGELAAPWEAGRHLGVCMILRQEPSWGPYLERRVAVQA